jgi:hypothetical protein
MVHDMKESKKLKMKDCGKKEVTGDIVLIDPCETQMALEEMSRS